MADENPSLEERRTIVDDGDLPTSPTGCADCAQWRDAMADLESSTNRRIDNLSRELREYRAGRALKRWTEDPEQMLNTFLFILGGLILLRVVVQIIRGEGVEEI